MRRPVVVAALFMLTCTALADACGPARVIDGDTLELSGVKVRLLDMDAPEGKQVCISKHACRFDADKGAVKFQRCDGNLYQMR